jgi:hypothetical protein
MILPAAQEIRDDVALQKVAYGLASAQELARQVDADDRVPLRKSHFMEWDVALKPGIVDEDINRAELLQHAVEHLLYLLFLRDVRFVRVCFRSGSTDLAHHRVRVILAADIIHHHVGAGLPQRNCGGLTDA